MRVDANSLRDVFNLLKPMGVDVVTIVPTEKGWEFYNRDITGCALAVATLTPAAFLNESYTVWNPFAVEMAFLMDAISKRPYIDVTLEDGFIVVEYGRSRCKQRLKHLDETRRVEVRYQFMNSIGVLSDTLLEFTAQKHFADAQGADLGLEVKVSEDGIKISFETELESYSEEKDIILSDLPGGEQTSHYGPEYLLPIFKSLPSGTPVVLNMDSDKPMKLSLNTERYTYTGFIAPRVGGD